MKFLLFAVVIALACAAPYVVNVDASQAPAVAPPAAPSAAPTTTTTVDAPVSSNGQADDEFVVQVVRLDTTACDSALPSLRSEIDELAENVRALLAKARSCAGVPPPATTTPVPGACVSFACPAGALPSFNFATLACECRELPGHGPVSDTPATSVPGTNAPGTNAPATNPPATNPPTTNSPVAETNVPAATTAHPAIVGTTAAPTTATPTTAAPTPAPTTAAPTTATPAGPSFGTRQTPAGLALTDDQGRTLYLSPDDSVNGKATCTPTSQCAPFWPLVPPGLGKGPGVTGAVGQTTNDNKPQATYKGRPVYRFASDGGPGSSDGHGSNGFVICPP